MIPHGLLRNYLPDEFSLSENYVLKQEYSYGNYSLVYKSNNNQLLTQIDQESLYSYENPYRNCYIIFIAASEPQGSLQLCQDELVNLSTNTTLPLTVISTITGAQIIVNEIERTRNESMWTFTKMQTMFTLATLEMQPFQVKITNANNTKVVAFINYERPRSSFDSYAYKFTVVDEAQYSPHELGLLLSIGLVIDGLRVYPRSDDEQY